MNCRNWAVASLTVLSLFFFTDQLNAQCGSYGSIVYVDVSATGTNNGTSWTNAYTTLQDARAIACSCANVTQIWVANGTYYPDLGTGQTNNSRTSTFTLCNDVAFYGGFAGGEANLNDRNWTINVATLSGDIDQVASITNNAYHVVTGSATNNTAILDGFSIKFGNANGTDPHHRGGGIFNQSGSPTIRNCIINSNNANIAAGVVNLSSHPVMTHCTISSNFASVVVGAMFNGASSNPIITNCDFISNSAGVEAGAMSNEVSNPIVTNCTFKGNFTGAANGSGGAVFNYASQAVFTNCVFSGNKAGLNGGAFFNLTDSDVDLINCTFSGNLAGTNGGAIFNTNFSDPTFVNCIIWNNKAGSSTTSTSASVFNESSSVATFSYSLIANSGGSGGGWQPAIGTDLGNNLASNPLFVLDVDPATAPTTLGNLRLTVGSPAKDNGNNAANTEPLDLDGNARIIVQIDRGPYEFIPPPPPPTISCELYTGTVMYVKPNATGNNNGTSWTNAYTQLQNALEVACTCEDINQIWVAAGTYYPDQGAWQTDNDLLSTFELCNGLAIYGGFAGNEMTLAARNWVTNITTLHGDIDGNATLTNNAYHIVTGSGTDNTAILDGFTITSGNANNAGVFPHKHGAGILNVSGSPTITNCIISNNSANDGAGMYNGASSSPVITNCTFTTNTGTVVVGGMINTGNSHPIVTGCHFISNVGSIELGAIANTVSNPVFVNCTFKGNNSAAGAAGVCFNYSSSPTFLNCLFSGNRAGGSGGAFFNTGASNPEFVNCTFSGNRAIVNGGGLVNAGDSHPTLVNCIIWNNLAGASTTSTSASVYNETGGTATFSYSCIANSGGSSNWNSSIGINAGNNIATNPLFIEAVNPANAPTIVGNLRLTTSSPCKDTGNTGANFTEPFDLDGNPRRAGCIDMGPYEFVQSAPPCPGFQLTGIEMVQECLIAGEDSLYYYPTWGENVELTGMLQNGMTVTIPVNAATWMSSHPARATVVNGRIEALSPGAVTISASKDGVTGTLGIRVIAPALPTVFQVVPVSLSEPDDLCAVKDIPVLIIRYIPTADGINLDVSHAPDFYALNPVTVTTMENTLWNYDERVRFALEEGSRFRDYGTHTTGSYMGYRVVDIISVYEPTPRGKVRYYDANGLPCFEIDYHAVAERFDLEDYINVHGVKEVWMWQYGMDSGYPSYDPQIHKPCKFRFAWESNMASPSTGDVSNSNQDPDDLPIFDNTYILYGQNIRRSQAEAIHNHGHQIERMLPHVNFVQDGNTDLFWKKFVGQNSNGDFITGRCGWTHMPPNTTGNYDYLNPTLVASDIKAWTPAGGPTTMVNVNTWGNANYIWPGAADFPQRIESQWYIYWMQSMPGNGNTIPDGVNYMTNWWDVIADWDWAIDNTIGLRAPTPTGLKKKNEVVSTIDNTYGSLRSVYSCAQSNDVIKFSPYVSGLSHTLSSTLSFNKNITIDGGAGTPVTLNASGASFAFNVEAGKTVSLKNLNVLCGTSSIQKGLRNFGITSLYNTTWDLNSIGLAIRNQGTLTVTGNNSVVD